MKGSADCSPAAESTMPRHDLSLQFPQDEYSLMFPPSPGRSQGSVNSCNSWGSEAVSPTPSAKSSSSGEDSPDTKTRKWVRKEKIGQGAQGSIYRCEESTTGRQVAVKVIWTRELPPAAVEAVKQEVKTMKRLRHRHLVRYLQATEKKQSELRIYMEYAAGGSLSSCLSRSGALPLMLVKRFTRQLCEALQYLHRHGIAHRDIKCANVLLTAPNSAGKGSLADIKLADFGTFKVVGCASLVGGLKGTPHWMAPEVIRQQNVEDDGDHDRWFRADVWSLGCAVLEMITGHSPWQQYSNPLTAMYQIVSSNDTPTIPADASEETTSFLKLCLQRNPEQRATISQLLTHPFVEITASKAKSKAKTSKTRTRCEEKANSKTTTPCNQRISLFTSSPARASSDLMPEPEPHEDSSTHLQLESPYRLKPIKLRSPLPSPAIEQRRSEASVLQQAREHLSNAAGTISPARLRPTRTPRLKPLELIKPSTPTRTNQDSNNPLPHSSILMPRASPGLNRGVSAGHRRLPRLLDVKSEDSSQSVSISPIRIRRIATAPTAAISLIDGDGVFPDTIRLPPLSARPPGKQALPAARPVSK